MREAHKNKLDERLHEQQQVVKRQRHHLHDAQQQVRQLLVENTKLGSTNTKLRRAQSALKMNKVQANKKLQQQQQHVKRQRQHRHAVEEQVRELRAQNNKLAASIKATSQQHGQHVHELARSCDAVLASERQWALNWSNMVSQLKAESV